MIISNIRIVLSPGEGDDQKASKTIDFIDKQWDLPKLYPNELRLVSAIEALINQYNRDHSGKK